MARLAAALSLVAGVTALDNGLGKKPGLGWNSVSCAALLCSSALLCLSVPLVTKLKLRNESIRTHFASSATSR